MENLSLKEISKAIKQAGFRSKAEFCQKNGLKCCNCEFLGD